MSSKESENDEEGFIRLYYYNNEKNFSKGIKSENPIVGRPVCISYAKRGDRVVVWSNTRIITGIIVDNSPEVKKWYPENKEFVTHKVNWDGPALEVEYLWTEASRRDLWKKCKEGYAISKERGIRFDKTEETEEIQNLLSNTYNTIQVGYERARLNSLKAPRRECLKKRILELFPSNDNTINETSVEAIVKRLDLKKDIPALKSQAEFITWALLGEK